MKKLIALVLALAMVLSMAACGSKKNETPATAQTPYEGMTIRLGGLKGPTTMGMVKLLDDAEKDLTANDYEFTMAVSADELTPALMKGDLDIIAAPANLASVLYHKTEGKVQMLAINTLGVLYIVEKGGEEVVDIASLKGKTILSTGKGTTPEYTLTYLLAQNGLDINKDVTMEWKSEATEIVAAMKGMDNAVAMLPQPFVTVATKQVEGLRIALDLTQCWEDVSSDSALVTGSLIVNAAFAAEHPQAVAKFLEEYSASATFAATNPAETAPLVEKYDIVKEAIAKEALEYCNIVCISGSDMQPMVEGYYQVLFDQNPAAVGGKMPDSAFYYVGE